MQLYLQIRILTEASEFHCRERERAGGGGGGGCNAIHGVSYCFQISSSVIIHAKIEAGALVGY